MKRDTQADKMILHMGTDRLQMHYQLQQKQDTLLLKVFGRFFFFKQLLPLLWPQFTLKCLQLLRNILISKCCITVKFLSNSDALGFHTSQKAISVQSSRSQNVILLPDLISPGIKAHTTQFLSKILSWKVQNLFTWQNDPWNVVCMPVFDSMSS